MAKAYKCDRCGKFYSGMSDPGVRLTIDRYPLPWEDVIDLCNNCQQAFKVWLESYIQEE